MIDKNAAPARRSVIPDRRTVDIRIGVADVENCPTMKTRLVVLQHRVVHFQCAAIVINSAAGPRKCAPAARVGSIRESIFEGQIVDRQAACFRDEKDA